MNPKRLSRRSFIQWSALFVGAGTLAACAPQPAPAPTEKPAEQATAKPAEQTQVTEPPATPAAAQEEVTIRYWQLWGNTKPMLDGWQASPTYKEMTQGFKVEFLEGVSFQKQLTAVASGDPPDVLGYFDYTNWFLRGLTIPVDEYVTKSMIIKLDDYLPGVADAGKVQGKLMGVPAIECFNRYALMVNTHLTEKAGLDASKLPATYDELYDWHKGLTVFDKAKNLLQVGYDPFGEMAGQWQAMVNWWPAVTCGVKYYDNDTHEYHLDDPKLVDYLNTCVKFYDLLGPDNMSNFRATNGQWFAGLINETVAMTVDGYWQCGLVYNAKPEVGKAWKPTWPPVPEYRSGTKIAHPSPHFLALPKGAKYPAQGFRLIEFLYSDAGADVCFKTMGYLPARKSYMAKVDKNTYPGLDWFIDNADKATEYPVVAQDALAEYNNQQWITLREKVIRHQMTAQEAMNELQRLATQEYQNQFSQ